MRQDEVPYDARGDFNAFGSCLRSKQIANVLENLVRIERLRHQGKNSVSHLPQIEQVLNEALQESQLTHHQVAVFCGLGHAVCGHRTHAEDLNDLLEEEYDGEEGRAHLIAHCRCV